MTALSGAKRYQAYPEYKDSGVEWSDTLPLSWGAVKLRWISTIYAGGTPSKTNQSFWEKGTVPWINSGAVNQGLITKPSTLITEQAYQNSSAKWIPKGSLVVALAGQGKTKGMVAQLAIDSTCNQSMGAIVPECSEHSRYLYWWITSNYQNIRNMAGGDLRDGLNLEHLGSIQCPQPSIAESVSIANFLDNETAKIDTLIEKQQQLIKLLKEKRQVVISHAVTKGLNPNVPMKDSGVEWLEEVPEHWGVSRVGWLCDYLSYGFTNPMPATDCGPYMLTAADIEYGQINLSNARKTSVDAYKKLLSAKSKPEKGDVLITKDGTLGRVALFDSDEVICISQSIALLRVNKNQVLPEFFSLALLGSDYQSKMIFDAGGTTIKHIYISILAKMNFLLPNLEEQREIVRVTNDKLKKTDLLIQQANQASALLQERRTALISAAVTGKIDVRNWQAPTEKALEQTA